MANVFGRGIRSGFALLACVGMTLAVSGVLAASACATPGVAAWGNGAEGELGDGSAHNADAFAPVSELTEVSSVAAGGNFTLALLAGGTVESWGSGQEGQLGIGRLTGESQTPVSVPALSGVTAVSAAGEQALALLSNGTVDAWGSGEHGVEGALAPKPVAGISQAIAVAAGAEDRKVSDNSVTDLALLESGEVLAWGNGEDGQLGNGETANSSHPVKVSGLGEVTAIAAGNGQNLALLADGTVMAWGENNAGQLGIGNLKDQDAPVAIAGLHEVVAIAAGAEDSLALLANGTVMAWGDDSNGELGPSASGDSSVPVQVSGLSEVAAIAASTKFGVDINGTHNLALLQNGTVMAWGGDKEGQLGNESEGGSSATPVAVSHLIDATSIAAGARDGFAVGPPVPIATSVEPASGTAGTRVKISGVNLGGATSVQFGSTSTTAIEADTGSSLIAIAPAEKPRTAPVTVTTALGTSDAVGGVHFRYVPEGTLAFGRCAALGKHKGDFKKGCTELASGGGYEWMSGILQPGFTVAIAKGAELVGANGTLVVCSSASSGSGEYTGEQSVSNVTLTFTGCGVGKSKHASKCASAGAPAGTINTSTLEGGVGFVDREKDNAGLELLPAQEGSPVLAFTCATSTTEVHGAVLAAISPVNSSTTSFKVNLAESRGKQHPESFDGGPTEVLEASTAGGPEQPVGLAASLTLRNKEAIELRSAM